MTAQTVNPWPCQRCGKKAWPTRRAARHAAKAFHPGERMRVYDCRGIVRGWHYGHPTRSRDEYRASQTP